MLDRNSIDIEKLNLFLKGVPIEEVFNERSKTRYIDRRYIAEFLKNKDILLEILRENLSNYMQVQYIDNFINLINYDLSRDERISAENQLFIDDEVAAKITTKTKTTLRNSNNHFVKLGYLQKNVKGGKGVNITINYDYLLENILLSGQSLIKFKKGNKNKRKSGINTLIENIKDKNLNEYLASEISEIKQYIKETTKPDFTENQKNSVLEKLYRWTIEFKNKKLKNVQYTVLEDRVYFYYNLKEALSNRDKQILDYLVYTGEIEAICFANKSMRYAIIKTPENIEIQDEEFEINNKENNIETKKQAKIQKDLDGILDEKGLSDISDNYYNALLQWTQYVGTRSKDIHYQIPDAIDLLERLKVSEDMKIEIINQTRQRSYTTVQYVIDDYIRKGKIGDELKPNKSVNTPAKKDNSKSLSTSRFEQFQNDCKTEIERLKSSGEDPHYEKFNQLRENYYKSKGWV